ncbi:glucosidase I [Delphinella strobiligena]|nr:glucosidase I [Delphinella strobiligena]
MAPWLASAATAVLPLLACVAQAQDASSVFSKASNDTLLWGPYKPNLYFGVRPRIPKSVSTGLLWSQVDDYKTVAQNMRYTCEQNEGMAGYGWDSYDPRTGGLQTIHDSGNNLDITTEFVKFPEHGEHGGSWGARIRGTPRDDGEPDMHSTVIFNVGVEGLGSLTVEGIEDGDNEERGFPGDVTISGETPELGEFTVTITRGKGKHPTHGHQPTYNRKPVENTIVHSIQAPPDAMWQAKPLIFASMKTTIDDYVEEYTTERMPPPFQTYTLQQKPGQGNMHMIQKVFEGAWEFEVIFSSGSGSKPITSKDLRSKIDSNAELFTSQYAQAFKPSKPFDKPHYLEFSKSLFSNLIGGIGYFYGDAVVDRSYAPEYEEENEGFWQETAEARAKNQQALEGPYELFSSIPSRPFFPRGFLWDEGFHLLPIIDWDVDLTLQIVKSWFNLMDEDGWIMRETILGPEARSKVPDEFQTQYPHYANPPTLFFVVRAFLDKIAEHTAPETAHGQEPIGHEEANKVLGDKQAAMAYLHDLYPLLKRHFEWFRKTQWGDLKTYDREAFSSKEGYRWRGSTATHLLTSGLDDYPRPQPPHPGELHTDLISWMGMMSRAMKRIASFLGEEDDVTSFGKIEEAIIKNIDDLHWDEKAQTYCDATIDDYEESVHVCHKGYISIFPFMTGLMDAKHPHLKAVLDLIQDPNELWSPHGIRSLSQKDEFYGTAENYWRSPIWMNMNYLIVKELFTIATSSGPHQKQAQKMYNELRKNLVETVYKSWKETGFAWEQYNPETGAGQRTQHFTGWTSLIVKIMAMPEVKEGSKAHDEL